MSQAATVHALGGIPVASRTVAADTPAAAGQAIAITCTVAGAISLNWAKGGSTVRTLAVGDNIYPGIFTGYNSVGTTATVTLVELWDLQ